MEITTALLCDFAQVREGLLFVSSGGITRAYRDDLQYGLGVFLAMVIEVDRVEAQRTHELKVLVVDEDGAELAEISGQFQMGGVEVMVDEMPALPLAFDLRGVQVERYGPVEVRIYLNGEHRRALTLHVMQQPTA